MYSYAISYDLNKTKDYEAVHDKIRAYGTYAKVLESFWVVKSSQTAEQIRDNVGSVIDSDDELFVAKLTGAAAWRGLGSKTSEWLKDNL